MEKKVPSFSTFEEFWPFYVGQHSKAGTRVFHFVGTTLGLVSLVSAVASGRLILLVRGLVLSYGLAWIGHFAIEKNRPATFQYRWWSFLGDMRMYGLMWRGRMSAEIQRLGFVSSPVATGS